MKMNHPIMCMAIPQHKDKNYGVDIYVPTGCKKRASKLIEDMDRVRECAELEARVGHVAHREFEEAALAAKDRNEAAIKARQRQRRAAIISAITPRFLAKSN